MRRMGSLRHADARLRKSHSACGSEGDEKEILQPFLFTILHSTSICEKKLLQSNHGSVSFESTPLAGQTADMGFRVVHLVEYVDELIKNGVLKLKKQVDWRVAYHDSCSLSRLSEPWTPWEGERGLWGVVSPPIERRRGANGVYQPPRDILNSIPGLELVETPRKREKKWEIYTLAVTPLPLRRDPPRVS